MAIAHPPPGEVIDVMSGESATLVRAEHVEVFRMHLPRGKRTPEHRAAGAITIQCLVGDIELTIAGQARTLRAGQLVFLADSQAHEVSALSDATLLISMWLHRK